MSDSLEKSRRHVLGLGADSSEIDYTPNRNRTGSAVQNIWHSRFIEFFEFSPIPFIVLSKGAIEEVNGSACELFGMGIGKIKKRTFSSFFVDPNKMDAILKAAKQSPTAVQSVVSMLSGERVRLHAMKFLQNGERIRIGLTKEVSDPRDVSRLKHVMLAAQEAICLFGPEGKLSSNKAASVLLKRQDTSSLKQLLLSLGIEESQEEIDISLESKNLWKRPISLEGLAYRLTISHIYSEFSSDCEYLVKVSPLEESGENSLLQQARSVDSVSVLAISPLTVIRSSTSLLKTLDPQTESFREVLELLENNVNVLASLFGGLNALSNHLSASAGGRLVTR